MFHAHGRESSIQVGNRNSLSHNRRRMTIDALKDAITGLPEEDRIALATWLNVQTMDDWDRQMTHDFAPGGRGSHVIEKIKSDIRAGKFSPMPAPRRKVC